MVNMVKSHGNNRPIPESAQNRHTKTPNGTCQSAGSKSLGRVQAYFNNAMISVTIARCAGGLSEPFVYFSTRIIL